MVLLTLLALTLAGCGTPSTRQPKIFSAEKRVILRITGADSMEPLLKDLAHAYMQDRPDAMIEVKGGGSRWGLRALQGGQAEIGMMSGAIKEQDYLPGEPRFNPVETTIARDGLAIIVHPNNPINRISRDQLADIFAGDTFRWNDLGWLAGRIQVVSREPGSGDRRVIEEALLVPRARNLTPNALLLPTPGAVLEHVAAHPNAIGYVSLFRLDERVKGLEIDGAAPVAEAVAAGNYPLDRDLMLVTVGPQETEIARFVEWVLDDAGRRIIERHYLPVP